MKRTLLIFSLLIGICIQTSAFGAIVYDGSGQTTEDKLIAMTLAGIVNRTAPRLYLRNVYETWSYNQTDEVWEEAYKTNGGVQLLLLPIPMNWFNILNPISMVLSLTMQPLLTEILPDNPFDGKLKQLPCFVV